MMALICAFFHMPQLIDTGGAASLWKNLHHMAGSWKLPDTFSAWQPRRLGSPAGARNATSIVPHSTTSYLTSTPIAARFCCMNSFMGTGSFRPGPLVEIITLKRSGFLSL